MARRRTCPDFFRVSITAVLLLLIWTATETVAQTADDRVPSGDADSQTATAQTDDSPSAADEVEPSIPGLDQMLRIALEHNPDIRAARAEVAVAEANLDRTRLTVVKDLTAYRDRWLALKASLAAAVEQLTGDESLASKGFIPETRVVADREKVAAVQLQLRELEAELPFLLGAPREFDNERAHASAVEQQADSLRDRAIPLAEQILALSLESYRSGNGDLERCLTWSSRLIQLQLDSAGSDRERTIAVEGHQDRLQEILDLAQARFQAATGKMEDVLAAEFAVVEAQTILDGND